MIDFTAENIEVVKVRIAECDGCEETCIAQIREDDVLPESCHYDQQHVQASWRETGTAILIKEKV